MADVTIRGAAEVPGSGHYVKTLDGLRAVSIVGVMISHAVDPFRHPLLASLGHTGVLIFFAISGYLITTRLMEEHRKTGGISLRDFYVRRAFRILPPALLYLATVYVMARAGLLACSLPDIKSAALLYINYLRVGDEGWRVGHFWSLSVEEHFYLVWPALLAWVGVKRGARAALVAALFIGAWRIVDNRFHLVAALLPGQGTDPIPYRTDLIADALFWGCCLAFVVGARKWEIGPVASNVIAVGALGMLVALVFRHVNHVAFLVHFLPVVMLGAIVVAPGSPIGKLLELAPLRMIGRLSYSLYIWQQLFLGGPNPKLLPLPWSFGAVFCFAVVSYSLVERPSIKLGRRFAGAPHVAASPALPTVGA